jgi:nanoRNase/pAp phosphatase (c-di-AMP/oligoRNAs hydrolase)
MQDGKVEITRRDITTNLPYVEGAHLVFDHHHSETVRVGKRSNHVIDAKAPSAARVVYDYYGGATRFPNVSDAMMAAVDKGDAAQFNRDEILDPQGWDLLNFLMDARTGLGRFRQFTISNYQLMMQLIDFCRNHDADEILALPDVKERVDVYRAHAADFKAQLVRCGTVHDNLVVLDLRNEETIWSGNRFMIYALYPQCNISIHEIWGRQQQNVVFAVGKSILDRSCTTNVGELMLRYGGGGHHAAGTCQIETAAADRVLAELITWITGEHATARQRRSA